HHTPEAVTQVREQAPGDRREGDLEDGEGEQERPWTHPHVRREQPRTGGQAGRGGPADVVPGMPGDAGHRSRLRVPAPVRQGEPAGPRGTNVPPMGADGRMRLDVATVALAPCET